MTTTDLFAAHDAEVAELRARARQRRGTLLLREVKPGRLVELPGGDVVKVLRRGAGSVTIERVTLASIEVRGTARQITRRLREHLAPYCEVRLAKAPRSEDLAP